jgi:hypothetical protein
MPVLVDNLGTKDTGGWSGGIVNAVDATMLPGNTAADGKNSALALASMGVAFVQKRMGCRCVSPTPITGSPAILGVYQFKKSDGTSQVLAVSNGGRLDLWDGDVSFISGTSGFTVDDLVPVFTTMNDLCFIVNGTDALKWDGLTLTKLGIIRPTVGTLVAADGGTGLHSGTYDLRVTFANSSTGHESSASNTSAASVTVTNKALNWSNIPTASDPQVDTRYLYMRNIATMNQFLRAGTIANNTATTATTNLADTSLLVSAPTTTSNNPPPSGAKYSAVFGNRLFLATPVGLYYSALGDPESFDPLNFESVDNNAGEIIQGIFQDHEVLMVFKIDRFYTVNGTEPGTWQIRITDADVGCVAHNTIVSANGYTWWWSRNGLVRWNGYNAADQIGTRLLGDTSTIIDYNQTAIAHVAYSEAQQRLLFALPGIGQTRNTLIIPFAVLADVFEASSWDPMDAGCLGTATDGTGTVQIYLGGYAGQLFRMWDTNNDGIVQGSVTGTVVVSGTTLAGITDSGATFDTAGGKLLERRVTLLDSNSRPLPTRPRITANTSTTLTFDNVLSEVVDGQTYTYIIGGPNFSWDTAWRTFDSPWLKKRFEYLFLLFKGQGYGSAASVDIYYDYDDGSTFAISYLNAFQTGHTGSLWDAGNWDQGVWDTAGNLQNRLRVGRVGYAWKARIRNCAVNQPFALLLIGMQGITQTTKR